FQVGIVAAVYDRRLVERGSRTRAAASKNLMRLTTDKAKRDYRHSSEPKGVKRKPKSRTRAARFIIRKTTASRPHNDFRLQSERGMDARSNSQRFAEESMAASENSV